MKNDPYGEKRSEHNEIYEYRESIKHIPPRDKIVPTHWCAPRLDGCPNCKHQRSDKCPSKLGIVVDEFDEQYGVFYRCPAFEFSGV
jgi:acetone carboxylase gamma subunit